LNQLTAGRPASADEILQLRLSNQHLTQPRLSHPAALVAHLGAVQSQDYPAALWALGQRLRDATRDSLEQAFNAGQILRTHVMRPTWHFVAPADIRWMLALTAPRVKATVASYARQLSLDEAVIGRSNAALAGALQGGNVLTRAQLQPVLLQAGIEVKDPAMLGLLTALAELDAVICSGPRRGKQHTYALLDERVPPAPALDADAALVELTTRYFTSHGPATLRDFNWWSGLTIGDSRRGIELCGASLLRETIDGLTYVFASRAPEPMPSIAYLLPNFDEYAVAYRQRDLFYDPARAVTPPVRRDEAPFGNILVIGGRVAGVWRRTLRTGGITIQAQWFGAEPSEMDRRAVGQAAERYGAFLGLPAEVID
jgi:hypothetical protein